MRFTSRAAKSIRRTLPRVLIDNGFYIENSQYFSLDSNDGSRFSVSQNLERQGQHNLKITHRSIRVREFVPTTVIIHFR